MLDDANRYHAGDLLCGTPYRVISLIACGGMGSVYEVEDESLGKRFALKALHTSVTSAIETERRMRAEARILGRLTHPNVVQVFTAGATRDAHPVPFIVMELLVGSTLRAVIRERGGLGVRAGVRVTLDLLGALEQAHELGLVHRDIKPDNVFLHCDKRGDRTTKLLDFGVADRLCDANRDPANFAGTFRYASPEQVAGRPLGPTSDLYSVGLLLFEMLAGHHAFPHARGREAIVHAHMNESVTLPHWPEPIRAVVSSALAKEPGLRPADAWTFASRLRGAMRAMGIGAQASACPVPAPASNVRSAPPEAACDRTMSSHDTLRDETFEVSRDELAGDGARRSGALASRESSTLRVVARPTARVAIASTRR